MMLNRGRSSNRWAPLFFAVLTSGSFPGFATAQESVSSTAPMGSRGADIGEKLTLEESIDLLGGIGFATHPLPRLGIPSLKMSDGPSGSRSPPPSTAYAAGIALASSWDPSLAQQVGAQIARDARSRGARFILGPGVNIYRMPTNGRNFEYFGEDPWLAARIAVGYIQGVQTQGVSATIKHFVGNESEFARHDSDSIIDERTLREIYLPPFESAVKEARVGAVMSSYNLTNGRHMSENAYLAETVLKREWGFDGVLMSDWGATYDGIAAANAGLDLEMPFGRFMNRDTLLPAVRAGTIGAATIADKVRRQLQLAQRFGWSEGSEADLAIPRLNRLGDQVAYQGALQGTVLLKNEHALLPLDPGRLKNVAVIGPVAHPTPATAGGSGHVPAFNEVSILEGLSRKLAGATVTYARGLPSERLLGLMTRFTTAPVGGKPGVNVEVFPTRALTGTPVATRVETKFSNSATAVAVDPDMLGEMDTLPPADALAIVANLLTPPAKTFERWAGWYAVDSAGSFTVFVQSNGHYRLLIDDKVAIDSARIAKATLRQVRVPLTAGSHKVVFEGGAADEFGSPFWRVGIRRDGTFVDPLAKALASRADAVVLAVGFDPSIETEGADREFALPPGQDELIREITAINPNTIVVVICGGAVDARPWIEQTPALIAAWYPGQAGGAALADLLVGAANPSGRLPISWERAPEDNPAYSNYYFNDGTDSNRVVYREGVFLGYRGYGRSRAKPLFPFGFGLSYTSFEYSNLSIRPLQSNGPAQDGTALYSVSFDVKNVGSRSGADIAQVYVGSRRASVPRPLRELKAFARTELQPGETRHVSVPLTARSFAYYDVGRKGWRAEPGYYRIELARSSEDIVRGSEVLLSRELYWAAGGRP